MRTVHRGHQRYSPATLSCWSICADLMERHQLAGMSNGRTRAVHRVVRNLDGAVDSCVPTTCFKYALTFVRWATWQRHCVSPWWWAIGNTGTVTGRLVLDWMKVISAGHLPPFSFHAFNTMSGKRFTSEMRPPVQHAMMNMSRMLLWADDLGPWLPLRNDSNVAFSSFSTRRASSEHARRASYRSSFRCV